ncbi:MAG TPA: hypothetical protein VMH87_09075 [Pseudomonadales bacterium]|nr:hypothetical protein [Pseudomonadales bacterium]
MFEHRSSPVLPRRQFISRMRRSILFSSGIAGVTLMVGMLGYHSLENMPWADAFANASMILAGMGPLGNLNTEGGKIFAGFYALFCGLIFVTVVTILIAPLFHRALHKFHCEMCNEKS